MKLRTQLNLAFSALLLVILTLAGIIIYSLILDMLIEKEEVELRQKGELLIDILNNDYGSIQSVNEFQEFINSQDGDLILYHANKNTILSTTMPVKNARHFYEEGYFNDYSNNLWEGANQKYVTSRIARKPQGEDIELILLTPLNDLQDVQQSFFKRLLIVFIVGGILAVLLSYYFTNRLVKPLTLLKKELKKVEKRQFDDLERVIATGEIKEVEQSLFDMADELKRYMRSQQTFFQNASHELKTPLMTIQGYAEGIKEGVFEGEERDKGLETMVEEIGRLKKIINEMIWLAKLESAEDTFERRSISTNDLIERVYDRVIPLAEQHHIQIKLNEVESFEIYSDEEKLLQAVLNITVNAIRHAESKVRITTKGRTLMIEDDGDGIPEDLIPYIFNRFVKGKGGETGLGLAIARTIIEESDGKLEVRESHLGGALFKVEFNISISSPHF
ncbi:HAMP domain-containing histidine kinase [Filobacillus milosensis]|uniref:histidine kinase n=1 Tax=Filobacillus milosensis TaxID=94137 RepID=A0A4Y8ITV2_9BACI|nr:HAMP domain-containing sensor histidine kinase [Filobacillus milosensis]TFB24260.1 HAMP domain-containing histidine kinase [Filobacillus milosensis]